MGDAKERQQMSDPQPTWLADVDMFRRLRPGVATGGFRLFGFLPLSNSERHVFDTNLVPATPNGNVECRLRP